MNAHKTSVISDRVVKRHKCCAPGARLSQPQHVEKICGIRRIPAGWFCEAAAAGPAPAGHSRAPGAVRECAAARSTTPKPVELFSASDVGQTFLSAGSGDFPVPGFRVKPSDLVREVGKLRNRQARKPALQIWATRFLFNLAQVGNESAPDRGRGVHAASTCETKAGHAFPASHYCGG